MVTMRNRVYRRIFLHERKYIEHLSLIAEVRAPKCVCVSFLGVHYIMYVCVYVYMYVCIILCMYACMCMCACACACVCMRRCTVCERLRSMSLLVLGANYGCAIGDC